MGLYVRPMVPADEAEYERLVMSSSFSTIHHSLKYRDFLRRVISEAKDLYFCAFEGREMVAALPSFVRNGALGTVMNSLPFFGSHGGVICKSDRCDDEMVNEFIRAITGILSSRNVISSTIVEQLFHAEFYASHILSGSLIDERIGQVSTLPSNVVGNIGEDNLIESLPPKKRWDIRKALSSDFTVSHSGNEETFRTLANLHNAGMQVIGGTSKPDSFYPAVREAFEYGNDFRIYTASFEGTVVSAMLVLYFKDIIEYFMLATLPQFLSKQPLSLLIYAAMRDGVLERNSKLWNWGGTWKSQNGVYDFKKRWGAIDIMYRYHTHVADKSVFLAASKDELLDAYPLFFVYPFDQLGQNEV